MSSTSVATHAHPFLKVSGVAYLGLMTNLLLVASSLPLVVLLLLTDPTVSWPLLAVAAVLAAPGLPAAFAVFSAHADGESAVVRPFLRAWRRHALRALLLGAATVSAVVVLAVDVAWASRSQFGAVATPVAALLGGLALAASLGATVAITERPDVSLGRLLKASLYLMVRRWYLTVVSLAAAGVLVAIIAERPAIGLGVAVAPLLYVVWANTRYTLRPILPASA